MSVATIMYKTIQDVNKSVLKSITTQYVGLEVGIKWEQLCHQVKL